MKNALRVAVAVLLLSPALARATPASDAAFEEGVVLMKAKSYAPATAKFEVVVAADGNNDLGWYQLAAASRQSGRCDRAIVAYKRYMDLVPNMPDPFYGLGLCLAKTGDKPGALAALKHYIAVAPASAKAQLQQCRGARVTDEPPGEASTQDAAPLPRQLRLRRLRPSRAGRIRCPTGESARVRCR